MHGCCFLGTCKSSAPKTYKVEPEKQVVDTATHCSDALFYHLYTAPRTLSHVFLLDDTCLTHYPMMRHEMGWDVADIKVRIV